MCLSSKSKSSQSSNVYDERVGADGGSTAFRAEGTNTITVGSDDTAQLAIESTTEALTASTDFIGSALTNFFTLTDQSLKRADENVSAQQASTASLLQNAQVTNDDRLITVIKYIAFGGVAVVALRSGVLKEITGAFK